MNSKLTLRLDEDLIQSAKSYSAKTGKSVSKIVADYFALIDKKLSAIQSSNYILVCDSKGRRVFFFCV
ncbi:MAG: DUF6364 family protein, partial [Deltaproteobacteria bacterium]|nr:DUF6364 family protein [Deltaproteobacteria bacterium]